MLGLFLINDLKLFSPFAKFTWRRLRTVKLAIAGMFIFEIWIIFLSTTEAKFKTLIF
jgi:hypothetical protein